MIDAKERAELNQAIKELWRIESWLTQSHGVYDNIDALSKRLQALADAEPGRMELKNIHAAFMFLSSTFHDSRMPAAGQEAERIAMRVKESMDAELERENVALSELQRDAIKWIREEAHKYHRDGAEDLPLESIKAREVIDELLREEQ